MSPTAPSVSIAMATYNGEIYIEELLDSIARQTRPPWELVVTDDHSSDRTVDIVRDFARRAPFAVRLHVNEHRLGYRGNFVEAAGLCKGDLIAFCDQDDIWRPEKLAVCAGYFARDEVLLVHHNARIVTADAAPVGVLDQDMTDRDCAPLSLRPWEFALGFTEVFRAELLAFNPLWSMSRDQNKAETAMGHDQWFFFLASVFGTIVRCGRCLVDYRQHGRNVFGVVQPHGLSARLQYLLARRAEVFALCRGDMEQRAAVLRAAAGRLQDHRQREMALEGARGFDQLTRLYTHRQRLYGSRWLGQRHEAHRHIVRDHGYDEEGPWTFRRRAKIRDLVKGVMFGPLLERFGLNPPGGDPECYPSGARLQRSGS